MRQDALNGSNPIAGAAQAGNYDAVNRGVHQSANLRVSHIVKQLKFEYMQAPCQMNQCIMKK